jgi:sugar/nucleoside kinase (ribokinase family)
MTAHEAPDYVAIGHITVDLLPDGSPVLGGTALYAALTAARFGLRAAVLTRGNFAAAEPQISAALQEFAGEIEIIVQSAANTTVMENVTVASQRRQEVHAWAGPIDLNGLPPHWRSAQIVHLAPVVQEIEARQVGRLSPGYLGATPQGWMRKWSKARNGLVSLERLRLPSEALSRIDALVLSVHEQSQARDEIEAVGKRGLVAITRGPEPAQIIDRGRSIEVPSYPVRIIDDTGAGDVYAATLFIMRAEHESVAASARMAAASAAVRISSAVGPEGVPTREQVHEFQRRAEQTIRGRR